MRDLRIRIENGQVPGPRLLNSGPYFGTARPSWDRNITKEQIYAEVDHWVGMGVKGFKAKGIAPEQLKALIERAHFHGLTVTGHLDSGNRNSVNPRDAILMGIDRIEHFMGGDAFTPDKSAYASYEHMTFDTPEFKRIAALYKEHHVYFDATLSTYAYYGTKDPDMLDYYTAVHACEAGCTAAATGQRAVRQHLLDEAERDQGVLRRWWSRSHDARYGSSELGPVVHSLCH
jgi:hypothetical protein